MLMQIVATAGVLSVATSFVMAGLGIFGKLPVKPYGPIALVLGVAPSLIGIVWVLIAAIWRVS